MGDLGDSLMENLDDEYFETHKHRFNITISHLEEGGFLGDGTNVLELGTPTVFTGMLNERFDVNITNTSTDLRYDIPITEEKFDLILCMELIEHIKDQNTEDVGQLSSFNGSGIKNLISECARLLKIGGALFVSTPNVHCYRVFENWCKNMDLYTYSPHPRELSMSYLQEVLGEHFYLTAKYIKCWDCHGADKKLMGAMKEFLEKNGFSHENRDSGDIFITCISKKEEETEGAVEVD
jgi:SAM-dependent methyltransferase